MATNNILRQYADTNMTEEMGRLVKVTDSLLQELAYEDYLPAVENILSTADDSTTEDINDNIHGALVNLLDREIGEYGIGFETYDLEILTQILRALHELPNYANPQEILDIAEDEGLPQEQFSEILGFYYDQDAMDFLKHFNYVNVALIDKLIERLNHRISIGATQTHAEDDTPETAQGTETQVPMLRKFLEKYEPPHFKQLLDEGIKLGYDINVYLDKVIDNLSQSVDDTAREYVASALASGESMQDAIEHASDRIEEYVDDMHRVSKIVQTVSNYMEQKYE